MKRIIDLKSKKVINIGKFFVCRVKKKIIKTNMKRNQISNLISKIEVTYYNVESIKSQIIKENKNKSGVYIWTNLLSGKIYVGSSGNLAIRLKNYLTYLENPNYVCISNYFLKHKTLYGKL